MPYAILTFDDVVASQLDNAVPILQRHGFAATFFVCDWFRDSTQSPLRQGMARKDLLTLHSMGYELANHSETHRDPVPLSVPENMEEIQGVECIFDELRLPAPTAYAYPGGPYSKTAEQALRAKGYVAARCTGNLPVPGNRPDPFRLPSFPVSDDHPECFQQALACLRQGLDVIFTYHGVPDVEHPWVTTDPQNFSQQMQTLDQAGITTLTFSQFARNLH